MKKLQIKIIKMIFNYYKNKFDKLTFEKLWSVWNLCDIYAETEKELTIINNYIIENF